MDTPVTVPGGNIDRLNKAVAFFLCTARPGRRSMTIPADVLQTLPATPSGASGAFGFLVTGTGLDSSPSTFQADGLNFGLALALNVDLHQVRYR